MRPDKEIDLTAIHTSTTALNDKLRLYAKSVEAISELSGSQKTRRYFDYEIRDLLRQKYKLKYVTNGWIKMQEILATYDWFKNTSDHILGDNIVTMHICEHPGKFIFAIKDFIKKFHPKLKHTFIFQSLNPVVTNSGFALDPMLKHDPAGTLDYGADQTGNIITNMRYYVDTYAKQKIFLITSDCGEDYSEDFTKQETGLYPIYEAALLTAIGLATTHYVFKFFSFSDMKTIKMLYLACLFYDRVDIVRLMTTKGNSGENYCVCSLYIGSDANKKSIAGGHIELGDKFDTKFINRINMVHEILTVRRMTSINQLLFRFHNDTYVKENTELVTKTKLYADYYTHYFLNYIGYGSI